MLLLTFHILITVSLFGLGMGLGGMIEFRRFREEMFEPYLNLSRRLAVIEKNVSILAQAVRDIDEELEDINSTQEIPIISNDPYESHRTMELINYDPYDYED